MGIIHLNVIRLNRLTINNDPVATRGIYIIAFSVPFGRTLSYQGYVNIKYIHTYFTPDPLQYR